MINRTALLKINVTVLALAQYRRHAACCSHEPSCPTRLARPTRTRPLMTTANDNTLAATVLAEALYTDMTRRGRFAGSTSRRPRPSCTVFASFATGLSAQDKAVVAASQRPAKIGALNEPSGTPAWRTIPSWYLIGSKD